MAASDTVQSGGVMRTWALVGLVVFAFLPFFVFLAWAIWHGGRRLHVLFIGHLFFAAILAGWLASVFWMIGWLIGLVIVFWMLGLFGASDDFTTYFLLVVGSLGAIAGSIGYWKWADAEASDIVDAFDASRSDLFEVDDPSASNSGSDSP